MSWEPKSLGELWDFYTRVVRPKMTAVSVDCHPPQEIYFEITAALDHLARMGSDGEDEAKCVDKAFSHLKRAYLDCAKIIIRDVTNEYHEIRSRPGIELVDNGHFEPKLRAAAKELKLRHTEARLLENRPASRDVELGVPSFPRWEMAVDAAEALRSLLVHDDMTWSARMWSKQTAWANIISFVVGVASGAVTNVLCTDGVVTRIACTIAVTLLVGAIGWYFLIGRRLRHSRQGSEPK